jgi:FkbM family methyltransferase
MELKLFPRNKFTKESYSQEGEDVLIERIMWNVPNEGFYIDIGAHHPIKFSNTYMFYKKGWRGINLDAMPGSMKEFNKLRPRDINLEIPISDKKEKLTYYIFNYPELNSFVKDNVDEWNGRGDIKVVEEISLTTMTIIEVLQKYANGIQKIDLLSIDIEGMDIRVLKTIDFNCYDIKMILIEEGHKNIEKTIQGETYIFLKSKGYELTSKLWHTSLYIKSETDK